MANNFNINTKLTSKDIEIAKAWLNDIFYRGGLISKSARSKSATYEILSSKARRPAANICEFLEKRTVDDIDSNLEDLSGYSVYYPLHVQNTQATSITPDDMAQYLAWFCAENKIYWDTSLFTPQELNEFSKTKVGRALMAFECFTIDPTPIINTNMTATANSQKTANSGSNGPKNNFRSTGPLSAKVRDLIGQPGQKTMVSGNVVYQIQGDNPHSAKVVASVHIKPLQKMGAKGNTNKVFFGSANGFKDCKVYFENSLDADKYLQECNNHNVLNVNGITSARVTKTKVKSGGYFKVGTEFGPVLIAAAKLNEQIEGLNEEATKDIDLKEEKIDEGDEFAFGPGSDAFAEHLRYEI